MTLTCALKVCWGRKTSKEQRVQWLLFTHKETGVIGEETGKWGLVCVKMNGFPKIKDGQKLGLT